MLLVRFSAFLASLLTIANACPQAFDWDMLPAEERAAKAPIVVVGYVTKSYKDLADSLTNYAVEFKILRSLKGEDQISELPQDSLAADNIYRITNFGSFSMCFADLKGNQVYMLFLTVVDNHLSAHYSDLFGAAEAWTMQMEDRVILTNFGYEVWSEWSACSQSCGSQGVQERVRRCTIASPLKCVGHNTQKRECNVISCQGVKNVVELADFENMEKGVISVNISGHMIYDITPNFYGQVSTPKVFSPLWPQRFSVLGRIRPRKTKYPREGQYLFSLSDSAGRLYLGLKAYPSPTLEVLHSTGRMSSVSIPLPDENINDGQWHQFGFGVSGRNITMYYNCLPRTVQILPAEPFIPNVYKSTLLIGSRMFAMDRGADERYEGALSQLVFTSNPNDAASQCQSVTWGETVERNEDPAPRQSSSSLAEIHAVNYLEHWEWSTWGLCSVSCGFGVKARIPFCLDESINADDCIPYYVPRTHEKQCYAGRCPECSCENNGRCIDDGVCECQQGWSGEKCEIAECKDGCAHGECVSPGVCRCDVGWSGLKCTKPMCFPLCRNGGVCIGHNQCECPTGYGGRFCMDHQQKDKGCRRKCQNGGKCIGENKCECPEGWRGSRCHKPAPVCEGGCANGGKCRKGNVCKCKKGFTGKNCESDVCGNCRNGGTCERRTKQCTCPEGFTGQVCQYKVNDDLCAQEPCQTVGKCIAYNTCYCPPGWFGLRCEYRKCKKYEVRIEIEKKQVKRIKYKVEPCDTAAHGRCRVPDGYTYETRPVIKSIPDYTSCDDNEEIQMKEDKG
ncbi:uncharacterized protein [Watersipora subatra]|uniref:uncharacterized protein isoform X2 n=1 Tax=Watersipora subatra TaxID=2589382 RepID=UPI00355BBA31